jgi:hypothetical protein
VAQGILAFIGRVDSDFKNLHDLALADHFVDPFRPKDRVVLGASGTYSQRFIGGGVLLRISLVF